MKRWLPVFFIVLFLGSCTIEKRLYNKGFYVEFRQHSGTISEKKGDENPIVKHEAIRDEISPAATESEVLLAVEPEFNSFPEPQSISVKENTPKPLKNLQSTIEPQERKEPEIKIKRLVAQRFTSQLKSVSESRFAVSKQRQSSGRTEIDLSEEAVEMLLGAAALLILMLCFVYPTFAAIVQLIIAILSLALVVFCVVWVIVWLCTADFGNFPWFWSGR